MKAFANYDSLSSNAVLSDFSKDSEKEAWEYCTELLDQPKNLCACSCHGAGNNITVKESSTIRHCTGCNLKVTSVVSDSPSP